ncbi:MAG: translation initiation factor IF-2 [Candidatus Omnitrophica bacterium CG07_land_8_20_14_0_80_50_8]|nr:MAG: translation initiation factor IF-2 [Candidatus Omnitrophica bacterium CG07_land_8_20_14_0_80_50_8]
MSIRVYELAKELKLTSKGLIEKFQGLKISANSHMSVLTDAEAKLVKSSLVKAPAKSSEAPSIENVKKAFLLQRNKMKAAKTVLNLKKPRLAAPVSLVQHPPINRVTTHLTPKAARPDLKKHVKPSGHEALPPRQSPAPLTIPVPAEPEVKRIRKIEVRTPITVKDLAAKFLVKPNELIQKLIKLNIFATINQSINFDIVSEVAQEFSFEIEKPTQSEETKVPVRQKTADQAFLKPRAPIVTFMGHVDHGKTSLLDAIRNTKVAEKEAGGITQHIGAYEVFLPKGAVTFLDTPGHEAFTAMRARGARATDVVVLVVAADDGVMPQTIEAINHAKAANVPIIVAINKMDLPSANPDRVKKSLMEHGLMAEEWGGKTVMTGVSAKTGQGIDELLEMLALESDLLELKANPSANASGVVIEAELSKESGVLATVLIQDGTLKVGAVVIVGNFYCKVRAMINDRGQRIKAARPSTPVEILGLPGIPKAGDRFYAVKDERTAKEIIEKKQGGLSDKEFAGGHMSLERLIEGVKAGKVEELKLIIKSDVQGSMEALRSTLDTIQSKNVKLNIIHSGIGDVSESDVMLAAASDAVVIGFHVGIVGTAKEIAEAEQVDVRFYEIIYEIKSAIEKAMEGLLLPEMKEIFVGVAEVRQVFKVSKVGTIAGCTVQKGKIVRNFQCRVMRNGVNVQEGKVESLKRFKDDAREVLEGFECGIGVSNFNEILPGDRVEVYEIQKKARKLE